MENAAKALEMAGGVMLGVILMALVAYFFTNISTWPQQEDDTMSTDQLAKFNLEFEVYEKKQMYGVDVISCLNKVISNNEKYAEGGAFLGGNASLSDYKQRENYWINVKIKLGTGSSTETKLKETLKVYFCDDDNKEKERLFEDDTISTTIGSKGLEKLYAAIDKLDKYAKKYGDASTKYSNFSSTTTLKKSLYDKEVDVFRNTDWIKGGYITLIYKKSDGNVSDMNPNLRTLLHCIQSLGGSEGTASLTYSVTNTTGKDYRKWTTVVWQTVLYDLKNRKFTCTSLTHNPTTGRVNEIVFEEI